MTLARACVLLAVFASVASAQPTPDTPPPATPDAPVVSPPEANPAAPSIEDRALDHFHAGKRHYDLHEWASAIVEFKEAYRLVPDSAFLFNLAQAYRLSGDCLAAHDQYKAYLRSVPADAPTRPEVEGFITELAPCADKRRSAAQSQVRVHTRRGLRVAGLATIAGGLVAIGGGAVFLSRASNASDQVALAYAGAAEWTDELEALEHRGPRDQKIGIALTTIGGVAVIGGVVMYLLGGRNVVEVPVVGARSAAPRGLAIAGHPGGAEIGWSWAF